MSKQAPIQLSFKSAKSLSSNLTKDYSATRGKILTTFNSYSFEHSVLTPSSAFRFTAPGVDRATRLSIRSGDLVELFVVNEDGKKKQLATGFLDETDTHTSPSNVEFVITGRTTLSQLIDNACIDAQNKIRHLQSVSLSKILEFLLENTRLPQSYAFNDLPTGAFLFQTNPGETKMSALQRYLEFANCLVWSMPDGQVFIGKPNFSQDVSGQLILSADQRKSNVLDGRSRRNTNTAIRQIVTQYQTLTKTDTAPYTINNNDPDMVSLQGSYVGRSVFTTFSLGNADDTVNIIKGLNTDFQIRTYSQAMSLRQVARENLNILEVEFVVKGHTNKKGDPYEIDQIYHVIYDDDAINENMYVYAVTYNLTMDHGLTTSLKLCRVGTTLVADSKAIKNT